MRRVDTSKDGFEYVGIKLTDKQFEDLCSLNQLIASDDYRKRVPVFNMVLVLKILGLLPEEMICNEIESESDVDLEELLQRKFGKIIE